MGLLIHLDQLHQFAITSPSTPITPTTLTVSTHHCLPDCSYRPFHRGRYCQEQLMPRITNNWRNEVRDMDFFQEMGEMGLMAPTLEGYGCAGACDQGRGRYEGSS